MTVAKPLTQREIAFRDFRFVKAQPKSETRGARETRQQIACRWKFDDAIDILAGQPRCRIKTPKDRARCKNEIALIIQLYELERLVETQESNGSKASAFQRAPRWNKRRQRAIARFEQTTQRNDVRLAQKALSELRKIPQLAQSLEQQAALLQAKGASLDESFLALRDRYKLASRPGRMESRALIHTIHRLQALASNYAPNLTWNGRNIPPALRDFILETLDATKIKHPGALSLKNAPLSTL